MPLDLFKDENTQVKQPLDLFADEQEPMSSADIHRKNEVIGPREQPPKTYLEYIKNQYYTEPVKNLKRSGQLIAHGLSKSEAGLSGTLDAATKLIVKGGEKLGIPLTRGGAFEQGREYFEKTPESWEPKGVGEKVISGIGATPLTLSKYALLKGVPLPVAMGAIGAVEGSDPTLGGPGGLEGSVEKGFKEAILGTILNKVGGFRKSISVPISGGVMGASSAISGDNPEDIATSALLGVGLPAIMPGHKVPASKKPIIGPKAKVEPIAETLKTEKVEPIIEIGAPIKVSPEITKVIEPKSIATEVPMPTEISTTEDIVNPKIQQALKKSTPVSNAESIQTKAESKTVLSNGLKSGEIAQGTPVRLTTIDELRTIINKDKLRVGEDFEGHPGISAQTITNDTPIVAYGANNKISAAIIFDPKHSKGKGIQPNEVLIHETTPVKNLRFVIDGHDKILTFSELKEIYDRPITAEKISGKTIGPETTITTQPTILETAGKTTENIIRSKHPELDIEFTGIEQLPNGENVYSYKVKSQGKEIKITEPAKTFSPDNVEVNALESMKGLETKKPTIIGPKKGYIRLYRGQQGKFPPISENPPFGETERGRWFSTDKDAASFYGDVSFVDIPKSISDASIEPTGIYNKTGRLIPSKYANKAIPLDKTIQLITGKPPITGKESTTPIQITEAPIEIYQGPPVSTEKPKLSKLGISGEHQSTTVLKTFQRALARDMIKADKEGKVPTTASYDFEKISGTVTSMIEKNPDLIYKMALGERNAPIDIPIGHIIMAAENYATRTNNIPMIERLANNQFAADIAARTGRELKAFDPAITGDIATNPVEALRILRRFNKKRAEKITGKSFEKAVVEEMAPLEKIIKKIKTDKGAPKKSWLQTLEEITCK